MFTPLHRGGSGEPLLLIHGFTDTWRTWELVLPALERTHDVLAPTLPGHAGGPTFEEDLVGALERVLDAAGWQTAHVAGNSLGGYLALKLAERGRARSVVALSPAGGWEDGDPARDDTLQYFLTMHDLVQHAAPRADRIAASVDGRRRSTRDITVRFEHIPPRLVEHMIRGAAACTAVEPLVAQARRDGWNVDPERIACPVRFVWGAEDALLRWPSAASRYRSWFPHAEWVVLDGVGHSPQLDVPLETAELVGR